MWNNVFFHPDKELALYLNNDKECFMRCFELPSSLDRNDYNEYPIYANQVSVEIDNNAGLATN